MNWKFVNGYAGYTGEEFWYDLTDGGYINPEDIIADREQLAKLEAAIALVKSFADAIYTED